MIKTKALPIILRVVSKLEAKPMIEKLKQLDLKSLDKGQKLSNEDAALLLAEMTAEFLPQLGKIEKDIIPLIASLKDVSEEDASNLDMFEVLKEIANDKELIGFFKSSWRKMQGL